jgi:hypothetical protein
MEMHGKVLVWPRRFSIGYLHYQHARSKKVLKMLYKYLQKGTLGTRSNILFSQHILF